jgi:dCTP deaminase
VLAGKADLTIMTRPTDHGVLPSQLIAQAIKDGWIASGDTDIPDDSIQPASLDLRLGSTAYRLRCSFLPDNEPVAEALRRYQMGRIDLRSGEGAILEQNRPYLIPLVEHLDLPDAVRAKANPKSSTGRLDIFTRLITDNSFMFDEVRPGYVGRMYLEVVPRTFTIRVRPGLALNQLRLMVGHAGLSDREIRELHRRTPLLFRNGLPRRPEDVAISNGLFMGLDLGREAGNVQVGYSARENSNLIDLSKTGFYPVRSFWENVYSEGSKHGARIVLQPEKFYLLLSQDSVRIPPEYAAEMTAYDPTSGELRTHYAGFFDPGFGYDPEIPAYPGSRAALEVRAHDVPFAVEHGQNICKLSFDRMIEKPDRLYGHALESNYQGQEVALSKHFRREHYGSAAQPSLFPAPDVR